MKTICAQARIYPKGFRGIVSSWIETKNCMVLYNFADQTIQIKVKWNGCHRKLHKIIVMFYIEKFDEMIDYNCQWNQDVYKTLFFMIMDLNLATI